MFLSVDPLADKYPGWNPYNYTLNNPVRLIDPTGMEAEHIEPELTKGGGKNGRDLMTYKMTGKFINRSSTKVDMESALKDIKGYFENVFSSDDVDGVDYKFELNLSIVNSMDDVEKSDHVLALADRITGSIVVKNGNGGYKDKVLSAQGVAKIGGKVAYVDVNELSGFTASHELGHLFGLKHRNYPLNLMNAKGALLSEALWNTFIVDDQVRSIRDNSNYNKGSNRDLYRRRDGGVLWNVKLSK